MFGESPSERRFPENEAGILDIRRIVFERR